MSKDTQSRIDNLEQRIDNLEGELGVYRWFLACGFAVLLLALLLL